MFPQPALGDPWEGHATSRPPYFWALLPCGGEETCLPRRDLCLSRSDDGPAGLSWEASAQVAHGCILQRTDEL